MIRKLAFLLLLMTQAGMSAGVADTPPAERAAPMPSGFVNVMDYGAAGDGSRDDAPSIQRAIDENPGRTIFIPKGDYRLKQPIRLYAAAPRGVSLRLDSAARLFADGEMECLLYVGDMTYGGSDRWKPAAGRRIVSGGIFDCTGVEKGIYCLSMPQLMRFENLTITNFEHYGFYAAIEGKNYSADFEMVDCWLIGASSMNRNECTGIYLESGDNTFSNIRIDGCVTAMEIRSGGNFFSKIHATMMSATLPYTPQWYNRTRCFYIDTDGFNTFSQCYADTFAYGWYLEKNGPTTLSQCNAYYWYQGEALNNVVISLPSAAAFTAEGCTFIMPEAGENRVLENRSSKTGGDGAMPLMMTGNLIQNARSVPAWDAALGCAANRVNAFSPYMGGGATLKSNRWYPVALVKATERGAYTLTISNGFDAVGLRVSYIGGEQGRIEALETHTESGARYDFALANPVEGDGGEYALIYMRCEGGETEPKLFLTVSNLSMPAGGDVFGNGRFAVGMDSLKELKPFAQTAR